MKIDSPASGAVFRPIEPRLATLVGIGAFAIFLRALLVVVSLAKPGASLSAYSRQWDGASYLAYASAIAHGDSSLMTDYDKRVFPGYPAMIALLGRCGIS